MAQEHSPSGAHAAPPFQAGHLDVRAFAEAGASLSGHDALSHYPRLLAENQGDPSAAVQWQAHGQIRRRAGMPDEIWLTLSAHTELHVSCQRCLEAMIQPLQVQRSFCFVRDEATAAALDGEIEEDVLVLSKDFDLYQLIEDELLMELPVAPRHEVCPRAPQTESHTPDFEADAEKPHPFAALQALKSKR